MSTDNALIPNDNSYADILSNLSQKEAVFVHNYVVLRMTQVQAALAAGYKHEKSVYQLLRRPQVADAIQMVRADIAERFAISRQDIVEGLLEAVRYARLLGEPGNMISGWREIAKITGQYEPEDPEAKLSPRQKHVLSVLEDMPEERLLELLEKDVPVLEGELADEETQEQEKA